MQRTVDLALGALNPRDNIVKLTVGAKRETFHVHEGMLCKSSEFFRRAMKPEWSEKRDEPHVLDLSTECPSIVALYVQWLYDQKLHFDIPEAADNEDATRCAAAEKAYAYLASAYVFGERVMDAAFKNKVTMTFMEVTALYRWHAGPEAANIVYEGTTSNSPLRRLLSDHVAKHATNHPSWKAYIDGYPRDLLADALKAMTQMRSVTSAPLVQADDYMEQEKS